MGIFDIQQMVASGGINPTSIKDISGQIRPMNPFTKPQVSPIDEIRRGETQAMQNLQIGLGDATKTLQPTIDIGNQYTGDIRNLLMGRTDVSTLPGYNAMTMARRDAISDLGTGMAGTGKFFSGTTAEQASDIGGAMQNQFMQQYLNNLMMGAQPGQQATSQLAGYQMGAGQTGAQIPMTAGTNIANMMMGQQQLAAQQAQANKDRKAGFWGDILGTVGTIGGFMLGGPMGAAAGGTIGSAIGGGA